MVDQMTDALVNRRSILAGIGLGSVSLALAACAPGGTRASNSALSGDTVRVAFGYFLNAQFAGYYIADAKGYYATEGLDVEFIPGGPSSPSPEALVAAGRADIGVQASLGNLTTSITQGNDLVAFAADFQRSPIGLLSLAKNPITSAEAMSKSRILTQVNMRPTLDAVCRVNNVSSDYQLVASGVDPEPLAKGEGDCLTCFVTNQPVVLEQKFGLQRGSGYEVTTFADMGLPAYADIVFAKSDSIRNQRDKIVRFMRATVKGWQDNVSDPQYGAQLTVDQYGKSLGLDSTSTNRSNELGVDLAQSDYTVANGLMRIDPDLFTGQMWEALRLGGYSELPDPNQILDTTILKDVFAEKVVIE
ncbi:ABC transporter substrate-binding protein [Rhodococcus globerulus]|uniref:ABC transporter substrate-binding protein n=1 Tax=Rhodococcus globerulus TaxID=33008 RepID=UPI001C59D3FE|nr:ABC transporter substrate-binding protein [Rhodococcus globerulus]QXW01346.1 ABC transporter substrate-binding protein [Rhodococcus globerulus]